MTCRPGPDVSEREDALTVDSVTAMCIVTHIRLVLIFALRVHQQQHDQCGGSCFSGSTEGRCGAGETFISFNAVEQRETRTRMNRLCPGGTPAQRSDSPSESYGVSQYYRKNTSMFFLGVSRRGQLTSRSISQFGLAPHFRQVPVGIYSTFRTCSSLSTALPLTASTKYLTDILFSILQIIAD